METKETQIQKMLETGLSRLSAVANTLKGSHICVCFFTRGCYKALRPLEDQSIQ